MRVIAGEARSVPLKTPEGMTTRPTTDRIKETLFNILQNDVPGAVFLDIFAGSGQIGIEALSRGARKAYFADRSRDCCEIIRQNLVKTKLIDRAEVRSADAVSFISSFSSEKHADIIFMDPPYSLGIEEELLHALRGMHYVSDDTLLIIEAALGRDFSFAEKNGFAVVREKNYKTNKHVFLKRL